MFKEGSEFFKTGTIDTVRLNIGRECGRDVAILEIAIDPQTESVCPVNGRKEYTELLGGRHNNHVFVTGNSTLQEGEQTCASA